MFSLEIPTKCIGWRPRSGLFLRPQSGRNREIAIRIAVGAPRGRIASAVFGRAVFQLLAGVLLGGIIAVLVLWDGVADEGPRSLVIVSTALLAAGIAACLVPVRRALAIEPAAAIKSE